VPEQYYVALSFNPHRTKGIYLGYDESVEESHSYTGLPGDGFEKVTDKYDWMVRVRMSKEPSGERGVKRLADIEAPEHIDPFKGCIELKHYTGESDGKQSYGDGGPGIRIRLSDVSAGTSSGAGALKLKGFRVYGSRYGSGYDAEETKLWVAGLNSGGQELWRHGFSYGLFGYKAKWVDLVLPEAEKDLGGGEEPLIVAFYPQANRYKGIYFH
jgi:hypothetical protein